jgi:Outer membrane protein beta-barrel domain
MIMATPLRCLLLGAAVLFTSTVARAQTPLVDSTKKLRLGLNLVPMPFGSLKATVLGTEFSTDTAFAFGVMPAIDYLFNPYFFAGFAPQFTFNVKGKNAEGDAGKAVDLLVRLGGNAPVADTIELYGYVAPGYSIVIPAMGDNSTGFTLGFHGGAILELSPTMFANFEIGYQLGYQQLNGFDYKLNYFQVGLGAGIRL